MVYLNNLSIFFILLTTILSIITIAINHFEKHIPAFLRHVVLYGKFSCKEEPYFKLLHVSKSLYKHFYVHASIVTVTTFIYLLLLFIFKFTVPTTLYYLLDLFDRTPRKERISNINALLALALLALQVCRRCYESYFISVFGKKGSMHIGLYIVGCFHYTGLPIATLIEMPKLIKNSPNSDLNLSDITSVDLVAVGLFFWAWIHQNRAFVILANLRKDKKGIVVTEGHKLPKGDWFKYISYPHGFAEIIIYFALTVIQRGSTTWVFIFIFVLANQVAVAVFTYRWYKENFPNIPKNWKAIFPFIF